MKLLLFVAITVLLLTGVSFAQSTTAVEKVQGVHSFGYEGAHVRYGRTIWNNMAQSGWFNGFDTDYLYLDWGVLEEQGNNLPDEVVDGFRFAYATDAQGGSVSWSVYFYDSCTGWDDYNVAQEAGFFFTGLPDATNLPSGYYWGWVITVDLEGSGYEFLLGDETSTEYYGIGIGQSCATPGITCGALIGMPPLVGGNGNTRTEDAFDMYEPAGNYMGTYWFGGYPAYPYATFSTEIMGGQDPAVNMSYAGIGMLGNDASTYVVGEWGAKGKDWKRVMMLQRLRKMMRFTRDAMVADFIANYPPGVYLPNLDITLGIKSVGPPDYFRFVIPMEDPYTGDFQTLEVDVPPGVANLKMYLQGVVTDYWEGGPVEPIDASNLLISNP